LFLRKFQISNLAAGDEYKLSNVEEIVIYVFSGEPIPKVEYTEEETNTW